VGFIVFGWVLIIIYLFFKRKRINPFLRLCKLLSHYGYTTLPSQGGLEIADMLGQKDYKIASLVKEFVYVWYPIRYGKEIRDKKTLKYLNTLLDQIKSYLRTQRHLSIK
jgi:hypothetical protein